MEDAATTVNEEVKVRKYDDVLKPLEDRYGEIAYWEVPGFGLVVAAAPENPAIYSQFIDDLRNAKLSNATTLAGFALDCVVHPTRDEAKKIFRRKPAFAVKVAGRGQELCGSDIKELGKD